MLRVLIALASVGALAGCASSSSDDNAAATAKTAAQAQAAPPQKTVFDPELQALQKAKDVQKAIDQGDANNRKAIDDAEKDKGDGDNGGG